MFGSDFAVYFIVAVILFTISICCRVYCRHACKDECSDDDSCCYGHSLTHPSVARASETNTWQPVPQQPQQNTAFTRFGDLSTETRNPNTLSYFNRTNFPTSQNTATIFSEGNSNIQTSVQLTSASQLYNVLITPSAPQLYNVVSESHRYIIPSVPAQQNSVVVDDQPPDYATVVLADLARGNEHTQYPRVIQKEP